MYFEVRKLVVFFFYGILKVIIVGEEILMEIQYGLLVDRYIFQIIAMSRWERFKGLCYGVIYFYFLRVCVFFGRRKDDF